jgi:hypothetical protein
MIALTSMIASPFFAYALLVVREASTASLKSGNKKKRSLPHANMSMVRLRL